jgi:hypothetical protein
MPGRMKMYVKEAAYDEWSGLLVKERVITALNWEEIEWIVLNLDSNTHTSLTLTSFDGKSLTIGGGEDQFVVYLAEGDDDFLTLHSASLETCRKYIRIGGQEGDYPDNIVVSQSMALQTARHFAETGKKNDAFQWQRA